MARRICSPELKHALVILGGALGVFIKLGAHIVHVALGARQALENADQDDGHQRDGDDQQQAPPE